VEYLKIGEEIMQLANNLWSLVQPRIALLVGLALLLIFGSVGIFFLVQMNSTVTTHVRATATAWMGSIATHYVATTDARSAATAGTLARVTATAQAQATATAQIVSATATAQASGNPYPPHSGTLVLDNTLRNNSTSDWVNGSDPNGSFCHFIGGAYHAKSTQQSKLYSCFAFSTDFSNFLFQAQVNVLSGDGAGIDFRGDTSKISEYTFIFFTDGSYGILNYNNSSAGTLLTSGTSSAIKTGNNQNNLVAVFAHGQSIDVFVNNQHVTSVSDGTFSHGSIGLAAADLTNTTEVAFNGAKVWKL
jgi:hypothetical protein